MHDKPQGYKRQANALNICRNQGLNNLYQTEKEDLRYSPVWNKRGECVGYRNQHGQFLDTKTLPWSDFAGTIKRYADLTPAERKVFFPVLPGLADVPFLYAEYGQNKSMTGKHGKHINIRKVRTSERPRAKYRTTNVGTGEAMDKQNGYACALVTLDKPQKVRRRVNRHAKVVVHTENDYIMTSTRSSRRFR